MQSQKLTKQSRRRHYEDACGTALGLELIGERWALLIIRELLLGPKRFSDIRADLPGISANVLTQRLEGLEANGLLVKRKLPPPSSAQVYELTRWGYEAEEVIKTLGRWAIRSPDHDSGLPLSPVSMMLSLRTLIDADRAKGIDLRVGFRLGSESFLGHVQEGDISIKRDPAVDADLTFTGSPEALAAALHGGMPLDDLARDGSLRVAGDPAVAQLFFSLFVMPPKTSQD